MSEKDKIFDILVIGAGLSGLCAAKRIRDKCSRDISIQVLEKSPRAGGQLDGFQSRWMTTNHFHAIELCRELGAELAELGQMVRRDLSLATTTVQALRDVSPFEGLFFGTLAKVETDRLMTEIDSLCATRFIFEDPLNMDAFLERKLLLSASKDFFRFVIKISCGFHPMELSVTDWLKFCRSMSSMRSIFGMFKKNLTHLVPIEGWSRLVEQLVEAIGEENIAFSTKVTQVELTVDEDLVLVADEKGNIWKARIIICAVPCDELQRIDFVPCRPAFFRTPNSNANITHVTNFIVRYESSIWRDHGFSGNLFLPSYRMLCFERDEGLLEGSFFHMDNLNEIEIKCAIVNILSLQLHCRSLLHPVDFQSNRYFLPYYFEVPPSFRRKIIFASSNASCWYRGFINGSVQGGIKAAILALLEVRPQTINYKDVTDMQCIHFKYFQRCSTLERFWYSVNLSSASRFVAAAATVIASCVMLLGFTKNLTGLNEFESE